MSSSTLPTIPDNFKLKSFWERPEGTTGMLTLGLLGLGGFFLLQAILPAILAFLGLAVAVVGKTILLVISCAVLAALLYVLTNKKFLTLCSYMFKSVMRKITSMFVEIDPIGIMKNYIDDLKDRQVDMDVAINKLNGQVKICQRAIATNEQKYEQAMATAAEAKKQEKAGAFQVHARQAGRLEKLNNASLIPMLKTMEVHLRALRKYREVTDTVILDLNNEVDARKQEREMILASHSAMRSAIRILNGDPDKKELFDQAMEYVVHDYGMKLGEIENFIETSKGFVEGLDLQNGVYEAEALKRLQEWETKADSILLGDGKRLLLEQATMNQPITANIGREPVTIEGDYTKFFERK